MDILEKYKNNKDVIIRKIDDFPYAIIYQERLCNLMEFMRYYNNIYLLKKKPYELYPMIFDVVRRDEDLDQLLFDGEILLVNDEEVVRFRITNRPERSITDSLLDPESGESPRDAFVENVKTNLALVRTRLKNDGLNVKEYMIGRRTKTRVYLLSVDDITDKGIVDKIDQTLKNIDVDTVLSSNAIKTFFNRLNILPATHATSSPDLVTSNLYEGQACVLVDGLSVGLLMPESLYFMTNEKGDISHPFWYNLIIKIIVTISLFLSANLLGVFYSFIVYQRSFLPITFQDVLIRTNEGVFLPFFGQIVIMLIILELYQFITIRSPKISVNTVIVVIGGFILSEKVVDTKIIGAVILSVTAFSYIITFIISNDNPMIGCISYFRIIILLASMFFGIVGVTLANIMIFTLIYKRNFFQIHFMYPLMPLDFKGIFRLFSSKSSKYSKNRPKNLCHYDEVMKWDI